MNGVFALARGWMAALEQLSARVLDLATATGARSWPAALIAAAVGAALLVAGIRLGPLLSAAAGGLIGWLVGAELNGLAGAWQLPASTAGWAAAAVLGLASLFAPVIYPMALGATLGALLGLRLAIGGGGWVGAATGALFIGALALALRRLIMAATAAVAGASLLVASLVALSMRFPALDALTHRRVLLLGLGAFLAVVGTAFQVGVQRREGPRLGRDRPPRPGS